ncbi:MAG: hypothetical protein IT440_13470 [Phycisphaeraceae bacterium]|nr:hypothetical protein [Phycisphaeraceae bacterium]
MSTFAKFQAQFLRLRTDHRSNKDANRRLCEIASTCYRAFWLAQTQGNPLVAECELSISAEPESSPIPTHTGVFLDAMRWKMIAMQISGIHGKQTQSPITISGRGETEWRDLAEDYATVCGILADLETQRTPVTSDGSSDPAKVAGGQQTQAVSKGGMSWEVAKTKAEAHVKQYGWTSENKLAKALGCSRATIHKAVVASSYLKARKAEAEKVRAAGRPVRQVAMTDHHLATRPADEQAKLDALIAEQEADNDREDRQAKRAKMNRR